MHCDSDESANEKSCITTPFGDFYIESHMEIVDQVLYLKDLSVFPAKRQARPSVKGILFLRRTFLQYALTKLVSIVAPPRCRGADIAGARAENLQLSLGFVLHGVRV